MANFLGAIGSGIGAYAATGFTNPLVGVAAGFISLVSSSSAEGAQNAYDAQIATLNALAEDRQQGSAIIAKEENRIKNISDTDRAETQRKQVSYRATMSKFGIINFANQTGLADSSIVKLATSRLTTEQAGAKEISFASQHEADTLFGLAQGRIDILSGLAEPADVLTDLGLEFDADLFPTNASVPDESSSPNSSVWDTGNDKQFNQATTTTSSPSSTTIDHSDRDESGMATTSQFANDATTGDGGENLPIVDLTDDGSVFDPTPVNTSPNFSIWDLMAKIKADADELLANAPLPSPDKDKDKDRQSGSAGTLASTGTSVGSQSSSSDVFGIGGV